ncbi:MAG: prepilin-type N-terminal cleavage/methylation domain-containing protein, partial [Nitrospinaceae bacterium]|nr:prepilin-type N-terminal cleavage/methylation domain-containing protein [Nitrospinaceae bacterium]NIR53291.1 prepilin-type N-terminal cleavage/methylation domain-containing protein [Nitrospinaceae bacterium]NIS83689.1 prepilin-type N-terminal cleavage/methylation domain-containing protein [Nitrospinaceae bacterium]NIT83781.1 prepilin-type N-terminal cleavage/methylation domain-containing protein [Nitrospinaceae bacterium]NIU45987.1 prepilin-type N-terminal cleavage/methylation domain-contain
MRQTQNESGFTLIEVLIAAILLAYGLIAYGSFSGGMVTQNANQDRKTLATELAREKLEDIRNQALQNTLTAANSNTAGEGV